MFTSRGPAVRSVDVVLVDEVTAGGIVVFGVCTYEFIQHSFTAATSPHIVGSGQFSCVWKC